MTDRELLELGVLAFPIALGIAVIVWDALDQGARS